MFDRSLFDAARDRVSVEALAAAETELRRAGSEMRGQCPLCGAGTKKSASAPFAANPGKRTWRCYVCGEHGDVVDLERALRGGTMVEAARRIVGDAPLPERTNRPAPKPEARKGPTVSDKVAAETWSEARPIAGTLAERYLLNRGVAAAVIALASGRLRFHPHAKWAWDEGSRAWVRAPALVAAEVTPDDDGAAVETGGVHCTYLARDGLRKAALDPAKRMWGPQRRGERTATALLIPPLPGRPMIVGEGIETVLSVVTLAMRRDGRPVGAMAALSLDRLQGGLLRDAENRINPYAPAANPERPAATWPGVGEAVIAVDRDMKAVKVKAVTPRGRTCEFTFDGEARARLCARFAVAAWAMAGAKARAVLPPPGMDFNDHLRRVLAAESVRT